MFSAFENLDKIFLHNGTEKCATRGSGESLSTLQLGHEHNASCWCLGHVAITLTSNYPHLRDVCETDCCFPSLPECKLPLHTLATLVLTFYWLLIWFYFLPELKTNFRTWFPIMVKWKSCFMLSSVKIASYIFFNCCFVFSIIAKECGSV